MLVTCCPEEHLKCPKCDSGTAVLFPTICIVATGMRLECKNKQLCTYAALSPPSQAEHVLVDNEGGSRTRNSDYALNVLFVLSFISSGDGGMEASRLCGLLGHPNNTTMQSRSFGNIEEQMSKAIQDLADEIVLRNLSKRLS